MKASNYAEGKSKNEILEDMADTAEVGSVVHEQQKAGIVVRCTEDIETSIDGLKEQLAENAKSSDKLSGRVFFLNIILTAATVVGAIATALIAVKTK